MESHRASRIVAGTIGAVLLAVGALVGVWAAMLIANGVRGDYENATLYLWLGVALLIPTAVSLTMGALVVVTAWHSARGARRAT